MKLSKKQKLLKHKQTKGYVEQQNKKRKKHEFNKKVNLWKELIILRDKSICQRCGKDLTMLNKKGKIKRKHPHHIISLDSVKKNYPELLEDLNNGILLCADCHIYNPDSAHKCGIEFVSWLKKNKKEQYEYLIGFIEK